MTVDDIRITIEDHVHAAKCAIEAGFDGVEITAGNGWLVDQFLNPKTNLRTDAYGGSVENRAIFCIEMLDAVSEAIGASRTAVRFSPFGVFLMPLDDDPVTTFSYVLKEVEKRGLAYVCLTQPRTDMFLAESAKWEVLNTAAAEGEMKIKAEDISLTKLAKVLEKTPTFASGGYDGGNCFEEVEGGMLDGVTFGRWFISNPDLPEKIRRGLPLTPFKPASFYADGMEGYTDYPVGSQG